MQLTLDISLINIKMLSKINLNATFKEMQQVTDYHSKKTLEVH